MLDVVGFRRRLERPRLDEGELGLRIGLGRPGWVTSGSDAISLGPGLERFEGDGESSLTFDEEARALG
jgi:hypothetical protein